MLREEHRLHFEGHNGPVEPMKRRLDAPSSAQARDDGLYNLDEDIVLR